MYSLFYLCTFILSLGVIETNTWDIAVSHDGGIGLETSAGELLTTTALQAKPGAMYYDPLEQKLFYGDNSGDSSLRSIDLSGPAQSQTGAIGKSVVLRRPGDAPIQGIAYDPVERAIFWTDGSAGRRIFKYDLPAFDTPDQQYEAGKRRVFMSFDQEMPQGITVDACRRKLYWTNANHKSPSIERSNLDGTGREVLINTDLFIPLDIIIDQNAKRIYWADDKEGVYFRIESAALDGTDRKIIYNGKDHQPSGLAISGDGRIFWTDWVYKALWSLDHNEMKNVFKPVILQKFHSDPIAVVTRLNTAQAYGNSEECSSVMDMLQNRTEPVPQIELQCMHGTLVGMTCQCVSGYTGTHCELPLCHNYCLGDAQCHVINDKPQCDCPSEKEGERCEVIKKRSALAMLTPTQEMSKIKGSPMQRNESDEIDELKSDAVYDSTISECLSRSPIPVLASLCCLLFLTTCVLTWKLYHSTRRPRIHKRIIVNKNQPMSARPSPDASNGTTTVTQQTIVGPDTCEITIENCCNMNICETPCFDPVSYREPTEKHKSKKEEKKNLLVGMESGEDLY